MVILDALLAGLKEACAGFPDKGTAAGGLYLAYKGMNDFYHPRFADSDSTQFNVGNVVSRFGIYIQDIFSALRLLGYGLGCIVVFRAAPDMECSAALQAAGFRMISLPRNPYVDSTAG